MGGNQDGTKLADGTPAAGRRADGWEPLCRALDLPVPEVPFPHKNKGAEYHGY
jgi:hypothetical protein